MRRLSTLAFVFLLLSSANAFAQLSVEGVVRAKSTGEPLPEVLVELLGQQTTTSTNVNGEFSLKLNAAGKYQLKFSHPNYAMQIVEFVGTEAVGVTKLGDIILEQHKQAVDETSEIVERQYVDIDEFVISSDDLDAEASAQPISGILQSSKDVFVSAAAYSFSPARFQMRGYQSEYTDVYLNGISTNDLESGFGSWSAWGGLNDATRQQLVTNGLAPADFAFGGLGGATYINLRPSDARVQTKVSYAATNRTYNHRIMVTYASGLMDNGLAISMSASRRWAQKAYVPGTNYDAWGLFLGIEKKLNNQHSLSITMLNAPTKRGMQGVSTDETKQLTGNNFYNPNWGYQNGEIRNAKVRNQQKPIVLLNHYWTPSERLKITSTIGMFLGTYQTTALNWYDAQDPRPDYYRKLPSYWAGNTPQTVVDNYTEAFAHNSDFSQVNWNAMYQVNYNNSTANGTRSKYIVENRITDSRHFALASVVNWRILPNLQIDGGVNLATYLGKNYKRIDDLLGGDHWLDIDQFAERDFGPGDLVQNDLDNPNRLVKKDDIFGYNYNAHVNNGEAWAVANYLSDYIEAYVGANYSFTQFYRHGNMRNGRFPEHSKGDSRKNNFHNFGVKGGATWKINGRNYINANLAYLTRAPYFRNSYIAVRTSDITIQGMTSEKIVSADLNYILRAPRVKMRLTGYFTKFMDQQNCRSFYDDNGQTFVNFAMKGIDKVNQGLEIGAEVQATAALTVSLAASLGAYQYKSRPTATVTKDNLGTVLQEAQTIYIKNFFEPNTPQTAANIGLNYAAPHYWYFGVTYSYFDQIYIDFAPGKRTTDVLQGYDANDPVRQEITRQKSVDGAGLLDLSIGKSFRFAHKYNLNLNLQVANVLNKTDFRTGGFEQSRYPKDELTSDKFPPKYFYAFGRTFYLTVGFRF